MNRDFRRDGLLVGCLSFVLAVVVVALIAPQAYTAPINYGDFMGVDVWYRDVTEDANSAGDSPPLFGAPTVSGNSIDFNPVGFNAAASGTAGNDLTDGQLYFMIEAKPGKVINNVWLGEAGDTVMSGFGTNATLTLVKSEVYIDILEIDGVSINNINIQDEMTFAPSGGVYPYCTVGGCGVGFYQTDWSGSIWVDLNQELIDRGIPFQSGVTKVNVTLDNTLLALTENGTSAFIAKKDADGIIILTNIPEPTSVLLGVFGLALGRFVVRRPR